MTDVVPVPPGAVTSTPVAPANVTVSREALFLLTLLDRINSAISNLEVNPYKVFDTSWVTTRQGGVVGDGVPITVDGTYKQIGYGIIPRDAWRDSGYLQLLAQVDITESNVAGGACSLAFSLRSSPMPDPSSGYSATTQHMEKTYSFSFLTNGTASFTLDTKINVSSGVNNVWKQKATGLLYFDIGPAVVGADGIGHAFSPEYDPTERRFFHLFAKATLSGTQAATAIYARCLLFNPRDGTCYAL